MRSRVWILRSVLGNRFRIGPSRPDRRVEVKLRGHSIRSLAAEVAGLGGKLEMLDPPELREQSAVGAELAGLYGATTTS